MVYRLEEPEALRRSELRQITGLSCYQVERLVDAGILRCVLAENGWEELCLLGDLERLANTPGPVSASMRRRLHKERPRRATGGICGGADSKGAGWLRSAGYVR